jgi:hypothetical protein
MPVALTCDCGARFDVDELLAGKEVPCPECATPVQAPLRAAPPRTSLWALASLVLALTGAFTLVGTLAAVLVGLWALAVIGRDPQRLKGKGLARAGVGLGLVFTALTLAVLFRPALLPAGTWVRQRGMAGQVDATGSLQMVSRSGDVLIERPSRGWGRARNDHTDDPAVGEIQLKRDLLLVNVARRAYVDVYRDTAANVKLDDYSGVLLRDLNPPRVPLLGEEDDSRFRRRNWQQPDPDTEQGPFPPLVVGSRSSEEPVDGHDWREWTVQQQRGGLKWTFVIRAYKKRPGPGVSPIHVIRAYTPSSRFEQNQEELMRLVDSARIPQ